jgi:cysteine desulfurase
MSTNARIYLDFNATAPLVPAARAAIGAAMASLGNPSSIHGEGRAVRDQVERARNQVAALVGRPREQIVFTSGGTEANVLGVHALAVAAEARGLPRVVATTPIEHPSLRGAVAALARRGWQVRTGGHLAGAGLVVYGCVNHELGTITDLPRPSGALVHVDAVQAAGKLALGAIAADSLAISAHKLGGPQGVGALVIASTSPADAGRAAPPDVGRAGPPEAVRRPSASPADAGRAGPPEAVRRPSASPADAGRAGPPEAVRRPIDDGLPVVDGGHQERGRRPGTENVLGIVGFGAAAAEIDVADWARVARLGDDLEAGLLAIPGTRIHGRDPRVGGTINAGFAGALGESIVIALDLAGVAVSTGAACTSGSVQPSPVLLGLGEPPERAREAVRFSLGRTTTEAEIQRVLELLPPIVERARSRR